MTNPPSDSEGAYKPRHFAPKPENVPEPVKPAASFGSEAAAEPVASAGSEAAVETADPIVPEDSGAPVQPGDPADPGAAPTGTGAPTGAALDGRAGSAVSAGTDFESAGSDPAPVDAGPESPLPAITDSASLVRHKHKRHTKRNRRLKIAGVVLAVLAVIAAGAGIALKMSIDAGRRAFEESQQKEKAKKNAGTVEYEGHRYKLNEHMATVCFMGYDYQRYNAKGADEPRQADAVVVVALNTETGKATGIVIPRDSMVDVDMYSDDGSYIGQAQQQIALQFAYGDDGDKSAAMVAKTASRALYDMPIDHYFALDINGVGPINDSIGGVTVDALMTVPGTTVVKGETVTLYGRNAERYVQYRDAAGEVSDSTTSALDRQARQVQYLQAFSKQVLQAAKGDPASLVSLYRTALDYTHTNLGVNEFSYLASTMLDKGVTSFDFVSLPGEQVQADTLAEYHLDRDGVRKVVMDTFYHRVDEGR